MVPAVLLGPRSYLSTFQIVCFTMSQSCQLAFSPFSQIKCLRQLPISTALLRCLSHHTRVLVATSNYQAEVLLDDTTDDNTASCIGYCCRQWSLSALLVFLQTAKSIFIRTLSCGPVKWLVAFWRPGFLQNGSHLLKSTQAYTQKEKTSPFWGALRSLVFPGRITNQTRWIHLNSRVCEVTGPCLSGWSTRLPMKTVYT